MGRGAIRVPLQARSGRWSCMTKPRTGTMAERSPHHWRLQVAGDPDLITGERRRLSRTIVGNRTEAKEALQRLVVEAGTGLYGDDGTTVGVLLEMFMATAALAPSTRSDWESVVNRHLLPELGHLPFVEAHHPRLRTALRPHGRPGPRALAASVHPRRVTSRRGPSGAIKMADPQPCIRCDPTRSAPHDHQPAFRGDRSGVARRRPEHRRGIALLAPGRRRYRGPRR